MRQVELAKIITNFINEEIFGDSILELKESSILSDFGMQSIEIMELVSFIERKFDCKLPTEFVYQKNIKSINSIVHFLDTFLDPKLKCLT
jgi:acyl carrier protein